jgi:hypothetical protein
MEQTLTVRFRPATRPPSLPAAIHIRALGRLISRETLATHMSTILLIILILLVIGALPTWPYSSGWGYYPTGGLGLVFIIVLVLVLLGRF